MSSAGATETDKITASEIRRVVMTGSIGNFVEWYDFAVYAYLAPVIASVFFPEGDRTVALLNTFAIFGVAFVMRPLGALVFGHYGDRIGRRGTLAAIILMMAGSTMLVGLLPSYGAIGIFAPILLLILRAVQGLSAGGEFGGAASLIVEFVPERRRGFWASWQPTTTFLALVVAALMGTLITTVMSDQALQNWGWRIPFLIGGPLGLIGFYLRVRISETPSFRNLQREEEVAGSPLLETVRDHYQNILISMGAIIAWTAGGYVTLQYMPTYLSEELGQSLSQALTASLLGLTAASLITVPMGNLSDRIGRIPVMSAGALGLLIVAYPAFTVLPSGNMLLTVAIAIVFGALLAAVAGPAPAFMSELVPTRVRYSGLSVSYGLANTVFGGFAPFILTYLIASTGNVRTPAFYLMILAAGSLCALWLGRREVRASGAKLR